MAAFGYVSLTIIVALTIPLAISLDRRARAELERENLIRAGTIAQDVGAENLAPDRSRTLRELVDQAAPQVDGRVIVVDATGHLIADSQGVANGELYATPERPEIVAALQDRPTSVVRFSRDLGADIMATAVPIVDESQTGANAVAGAVRITRSMDQVDATVHRVTLGVVAIGAAGLAAGLILAFAAVGVSGTAAASAGRRGQTVRIGRSVGTGRRHQGPGRGRAARHLVRSHGRAGRGHRAGPA